MGEERQSVAAEELDSKPMPVAEHQPREEKKSEDAAVPVLDAISRKVEGVHKESTAPAMAGIASGVDVLAVGAHSNEMQSGLSDAAAPKEKLYNPASGTPAATAEPLPTAERISKARTGVSERTFGEHSSLTEGRTAPNEELIAGPDQPTTLAGKRAVTLGLSSSPEKRRTMAIHELPKYGSVPSQPPASMPNLPGQSVETKDVSAKLAVETVHQGHNTARMSALSRKPESVDDAGQSSDEHEKADNAEPTDLLKDARKPASQGVREKATIAESPGELKPLASADGLPEESQPMEGVVRPGIEEEEYAKSGNVDVAVPGNRFATVRKDRRDVASASPKQGVDPSGISLAANAGSRQGMGSNSVETLALPLKNLSSEEGAEPQRVVQDDDAKDTDMRDVDVDEADMKDVKGRDVKDGDPLNVSRKRDAQRGDGGRKNDMECDCNGETPAPGGENTRLLEPHLKEGTLALEHTEEEESKGEEVLPANVVEVSHALEERGKSNEGDSLPGEFRNETQEMSEIFGPGVQSSLQPAQKPLDPAFSEVHEQKEELDEEMEDVPRKRSRRSLARNKAPTRAIRSRASARLSNVAEPIGQPPDEQILHIPAAVQGKEQVTAAVGDGVELEEETDKAEKEETPRPRQTEKGLRMKVGDSVFVTIDQLPEVKRKRMRDKMLKPIEELTFADIRSYNRDQLRCYCFIYSTPRQKKVEMEADMARFVSLWNEGRPGYLLSEYIPNAPRGSSGAAAAGISIATGGAPGSGIRNDDASGAVSVEPNVRSSRRSSAAANRAGTAVTGAASATIETKMDLSRNGDDPPGENDSAARTPPKDVRQSSRRAAEKTPVRGSARPSSRTPSRSGSRGQSKTLVPGPSQSSVRRAPMRAPGAVSMQPIAIKPNLPREQGREAPIAPGRGNPTSIAPASTTPLTLNMPEPNAFGASAVTPNRSNLNSTVKGVRSAVPTQPLPKGFGTSFKQKVHARTAGAKFKAAYNGAGPAIVNIVENAAAYFEGKDSPEVISDQAKSYERYQFNVDLLSEIFNGAPPETSFQGAESNPTDDPGEERRIANNTVLQDIAKRMRKRTSSEMAAELSGIEEKYRRLEAETKVAERANMRMFQRLERAETDREIEAVKRDFEREHNVHFEDAPPPLVRRKLDKSLPPLIMSDDQCRILRFKVA